MNKTTIPLGITAGLALSIAMLYPISGNDFSHAGEESTGYAEMLTASVGAIIAMIIVVRKNPEVKFGQYIKQGVFTSLITVLVLYIASVVYFKFINPTYLGNYVDAIHQKRALKITDATKKAEFWADAEKYRNVYINPFLYSLITSISTFMLSLMPIAICGYIIFRVNRWRARKTVK